jgi:thymidylate synthase
MEQFIGPINVTYPAAVHAVLFEGKIVPSRIEPTLEIHPAMFEVPNPHHRLVTSWGRPVNVAFALAEVLWILGGRDDVATLAAFNDNISQYSDDGKRFNAAYGARLRTAHGHDQLKDIIRTLQETPDSRQAILNIWLPSADRGFAPDWDAQAMTGLAHQIPHVTKDRACNVMAHLMVRDGVLNWLQIIRSNDIVWGTPYNFMQWMHIHEYVAQAVGVPMGTYRHLADSLHMYAKHQAEASATIFPFDLYEALGPQSDHKGMGFVGAQRVAIETMLAHVSMLMAAEDFRDLPVPDPTIVGPYWYDVWPILVAYRAYKMKHDADAAHWLGRCDDNILKLAQLRHFASWRWEAEHPDFIDALTSGHGDIINKWCHNKADRRIGV